MNPVKRAYQSIHEAARHASAPTAHQSNQPTGTGKTYQAIMTSGDALKQAKASRESLVVVYVAPQHGHIDIDNHFSHETQKILLQVGIPSVKVESKSLLTDPDDARNLYRGILEQEKRLKQRDAARAGESKRACSSSLVKRLQTILADLKPDKDKEPFAEDYIDQALAETVRQEARLRAFRRNNDLNESDLEKPIEELQKAHEDLYTLMNKAIEAVLKQASILDHNVVSVLQNETLRRPFLLFQRLLFPWYEIVRQPGAPLGLVAMTAARLMTQHAFPAELIRERRAGEGDFTRKYCYLEDAVHGLIGDTKRIHGLKEARTRFLFLIDEADAVKGILEEPATPGEQEGRMHLRGMLLDREHATQIGQTFLEQMPLMFWDKSRLDALMVDYEALFDQFSAIKARSEVKKVADKDKLPPLSQDATEALGMLRARHQLGSLDTTHLIQQVRLRERLLVLLEQQYTPHLLMQ